MDAFVERTHTPSDISVDASVEKVHEVRLAKSAERYKLLPRQGCHSHVVQVADGHPLLLLAWQQDALFDVSHHISEHLIKDFWLDYLWRCLLES